MCVKDKRNEFGLECIWMLILPPTFLWSTKSFIGGVVYFYVHAVGYCSHHRGHLFLHQNNGCRIWRWRRLDIHCLCLIDEMIVKLRLNYCGGVYVHTGKQKVKIYKKLKT